MSYGDKSLSPEQKRQALIRLAIQRGWMLPQLVDLTLTQLQLLALSGFKGN